MVETALLNDRGVIAVSGEDAPAFLQGLITNDIHAATPSRSIFAALLSPQGKWLFEFFITTLSSTSQSASATLYQSLPLEGRGQVGVTTPVTPAQAGVQQHSPLDSGLRRNDALYLLDTQREHIPALIKKLSMYRLRSKVEIRDVSNEWQVLATWGEGVHRTHGLPEQSGATTTHEDRIVYVDPRLPAMGVRILAPKSIPLPDTWHLTPGTSYHQYRLSLAIPEGSHDATERTFPMENGYDALNGISFTKGCYVGQEVTARMKYRASLRKCLFAISTIASLPAAGTPILLGTDEVGEMRSSAGSHGLALIRIEAWQKSTSENIPLTCGGITLTATVPEWFAHRMEELQKQAD